MLFPICSYFLDKTFHLGLPLRYLFDLSILVLTYVMLGLGLNIVVGLAGLLDLGYVAFYAVGAYTFALLASHFGLGFWICLPLAGLLAALWGVVLGFPVLRLRGDYLAIVTLAFGEIVRIVLLNWTAVTNGPNGISDIPKPTFFGLPFSANGAAHLRELLRPANTTRSTAIIFLYYVILGLALHHQSGDLRLRRLPIGRAWEAMREDEIACRSLGINTTIAKLTAFATGAMFGGFAGCFFATRQGFISPEILHLHRIRHHPRHRRAWRHGQPDRRRARGDRDDRRLRGCCGTWSGSRVIFGQGLRSRAIPHAAVRRRHGGDHAVAAARHHRHRASPPSC